MIKHKFNGCIEYMLDSGSLHNPHGPAKIEGGYKAYLLNGRWKNIVGPARISPTGNKQYIIDSVFI